MASIVGTPTGRTLKNGKPEIGPPYRYFVFKKGHRRITEGGFKLKSDCEAEGKRVEERLRGGASYDMTQLRQNTVGHVIALYRDEKLTGAHQKSAHTRCNSFLEQPWSKLDLTSAENIAREISVWARKREVGSPREGISQVLPQTIVAELNLLQRCFKHAKAQPHNIGPAINPLLSVTRPECPHGERDVTWTDDDLQSMLDHFGFDIDTPPVYAAKKRTRWGDTSIAWSFPWALLLLRHSGLRLGAVVRLTRSRLNLNPGEEAIFIPKSENRKNKKDYWQPIDDTCAAILRKLCEYRVGHERLLTSTPTSVSVRLAEEIGKAAETNPNLIGKRPHDLRHTWTTETVPLMFENGATRFDVIQATGRASDRSLLRYFNPPQKRLKSLLKKRAADTPPPSPDEVARRML